MIPSIKHILYVSDIAEGSKPAFRIAVSLAKQYSASIIFLHVITPIPESVILSLEGTLSADEFRNLRQDGIYNLKHLINERIMTFCESELENFDWKPKIQSIISKGNVHGTITEVVEVKNVDIIVMGTRTHSAAKQFFMGSIVNKVMRNSDVPVMVVCTKSALSFK